MWPWYEFAFSPERTTKIMLKSLDCDKNRNALVSEMTFEMNKLNEDMTRGVYSSEILASLGRGKGSHKQQK